MTGFAVRYGRRLEHPGKDERPSGSDSRQSSSGRAVAIQGAALTVAIAPLLVGSGPPWAQLVSSGLAFVVAVLFVITRGPAVRAIPFAGAAALAVGMTALQLLPLPALVVRLLSPRAHELRAEAAGASSFFLPLTLDVPATVLALARGLGCLGLLVVVGTAARRYSRARPLVLTLAFVGGVIAVIHFVQRLTGATHILGVYAVEDLPGSGFFGTFVNGNQASSLFALSGIIAAGLAVEAHGALRFAVLGSALASIGALFSTGSRAGLLGLGAGAVAFGTLVLSRRVRRARALIVSLVLVGVTGTAAVLTSDSLRTRVAATASDHMADQKIRGWRDSARVVAAYPWTGVGRGAFEAPAGEFRQDSEGVRLVFPENLGLQLASEWGLPFTLLLVVLVVLAGRKVVPLLPRLEPSTQAAACGVMAVLLHELADFGLELPGVAFPAVAAVGLVVARGEDLVDPRRERGRRLGPRWAPAALAGWAVVLAAGLWALPRTLLAEGERLKEAVRRKDPEARPALATAIRRHPADYYLELLAGTAAMTAGDPGAGRHLGRAQRLNPTDRNVHLVTAYWLARNGRRSQAALEFRLARERGATTTLDELRAAVGDRYLGDGVPQTDAHLLEAAAFLMRKGRLDDARRVSARAVELAPQVEPALRRRLEIAVESRDAGFVEEAARALTLAANDPAAFVAAAKALAGFGRMEASEAAIDQGLVVNPRDAAIVLAGSRLRLDRGDLTGAISLLNRATDESLTLKDRIQFEEMRAAIAEKRGDPATAAAYHSRARALSRLSAAEAER
jgi:Flp pilus assembly protein TadD/O-antigen ligase